MARANLVHIRVAEPRFFLAGYYRRQRIARRYLGAGVLLDQLREVDAILQNERRRLLVRGESVRC
jgi:hypothetical protein